MKPVKKHINAKPYLFKWGEKIKMEVWLFCTIV